ncbi:MAG: hypothetical protein VB021_09355 [Oscillospiraceae bacterium]|nr:hypothetical protein [Oscillospiraceae bacterium]
MPFCFPKRWDELIKEKQNRRKQTSETLCSVFFPVAKEFSVLFPKRRANRLKKNKTKENKNQRRCVLNSFRWQSSRRSVSRSERENRSKEEENQRKRSQFTKAFARRGFQGVVTP